MSYTRTKNLTFSPTAGTTFDATDFGYGKKYTFMYLKLLNISTGTVSIKFESTDDWVEIALPFELAYSHIKEFSLQSDQAGDQTIDAIASFSFIDNN